ncbi:MAG: deoxyguanosinetriphosphate triphosphohydrolase [Oxalobacter sp.]|nr:MAG: deoxyguanosinetriphosphate triphosphohydrolase [Oxalobacter sp.]
MDKETHLAPYAVRAAYSNGRVHPEAPPVARTEFQRDRDRIIHSAAFRRLEYKTQVFLNHEGDLFRTRLTHSLEVSQIARSMARSLRLNEDLVEAIALAHDLGHTPFGHAGQDALDERMQDFGGFEHNLQSLRVVDLLEERYGAFDGLNLMFETREGILKRCKREAAERLGALGERFLKNQQASLEAQLTNLADEIAYSNHDIDDGLRSGLLNTAQLEQVGLYARHRREVEALMPGIGARRAIHETVRRMINAQIEDAIRTSMTQIDDAKPNSVDDVRRALPLISFSESMRAQTIELKDFLFENLYRHYRVNRMTSKARRMIAELFEAFSHAPGLLPPEYQVKGGDQNEQARRIADYIAGMTDRYAISEHRRIFDMSEN